MRIGIDCRALAGGEHAGIGHYIVGLTMALLAAGSEHEFVLFCYADAIPSALRGAVEQNPCACIAVVPERLRRIPFFGRHLLFSLFVRRQCLAIFHGPANALPLGIAGCCTVTVHDLAMYRHPEWFPGGSWFSQHIVVPWSLRRADRIVAVSEATKTEIGELFGHAAKTVVVREGVQMRGDSVGPAGAARAMAGVGQFVLFIGTVEPRKNLPFAIEAFVRLVKSGDSQHADLSFLIAGKLGWKTEETLHAIRSANASLGGERVRRLGYVSAEEKAALLNGAETLLFPSLHEGFGLPVLEAMAAGCPVICSDRGALPEVAGGAARVLSLEHVDEWAAAIKGVLENKTLRQDMAERGRERAGQFRWERAAGEMMREWKG